MSEKSAEDIERALAELLSTSAKKSEQAREPEGEFMDRLRACEAEVNER